MSVVRWLSVVVMTLTCWGCPGQAFNSPKSADPVQVDVAPGTAVEGGEVAAAPEAAPAAEPEKRPNALQREAELVDRRAYMAEHPNAIELEKNVINASDPFTGAAQGYFAGVSSLMVSAYQHDLQLQKQLNNDRWPSYAQYKQILDTHGVKLKGLKLRQVYAYDDETGKISILELPGEDAVSK